MQRNTRKQTKQKKSPSLCRLALSWNTILMLSLDIYNSNSVFTSFLHWPKRSVRSESLCSSQILSEHVSCPEQVSVWHTQGINAFISQRNSFLSFSFSLWLIFFFFLQFLALFFWLIFLKIWCFIFYSCFKFYEILESVVCCLCYFENFLVIFSSNIFLFFLRFQLHLC